jgi:hypothetical protein
VNILALLNILFCVIEFLQQTMIVFEVPLGLLQSLRVVEWFQLLPLFVLLTIAWCRTLRIEDPVSFARTPC